MSLKIEQCPRCGATCNEDIETECDECGFNFEKDAVCNNPFCGSIFNKEDNPSDEEPYECKCPICSSDYVDPGQEGVIKCLVCNGYYLPDYDDQCPWC